MGMYDEITFQCPGCDQTIVVQSKAGKCSLAGYSCSAVPLGIAEAIDGETVHCDNCEKVWKAFKLNNVKTIPMALRPRTEGED